jgi:hypothetical protein
MLEVGCPSCNNIVKIGVAHAYDSVTSCEECFNASSDYIFTQLVREGLSPSSSFIKKVLEYFDDYLNSDKRGGCHYE